MSDAADPALDIEIGAADAAGRSTIYVRLGDRVVHCDSINLLFAKSRAAFLGKCKQKAPALTEEALDGIEAELVAFASRGKNGEAAAHDEPGPAPADPIATRDAAADVALGSLPEILVNTRQLRHVVNDSWQALLARGTPSMPAMFVRDGFVVRVVQRDMGPAIALISEHQMGTVLARSANWLKATRDGYVPVHPPMRVAKDMVELPQPGLPALEAIVSTPIVSASGAVLAAAGYYPDDRVILNTPLQIASVPSAPSVQDVARARALLDEEILVDFPFVTPADRVHAIAAAVTPFVRRLIKGTSPLISWEAPTPGSGKGLLAAVMTDPITGGQLRTHSFPTNESEFRKAITALLLEVPPAVLLDNAAQGYEVRSPTLAALLTMDPWGDRILGFTRTVLVPNRTLWMLTGNNPRFSIEMARRTLRVRLDPKRDRPWERTVFRHAELRSWAMDHRAEIVHAIHVLVQHWIAQGRPQPAVSLGSFEGWSRVVGGIVTAAGYPGFLADRESIYEVADSESSNWAEFTLAWWEMCQDAAQSVSKLRDLCLKHNFLPDVLSEGSDRSQVTRLGSALSTQRDRVYGELRIELARDAGHKGKQYRLVKQLPLAGEPSGDLGGTLPAEGSPTTTPSDVPTYDDWGTSGDLPRDPADVRTHDDIIAGNAPRAPADVDMCTDSRPERIQGSPGSPPRVSGDLTAACDGEPWTGKVPLPFAEVPLATAVRVPARAADHDGAAPIDGADDEPDESPVTSASHAAEMSERSPTLPQMPWAHGHRARPQIGDLDPGDVCCAAVVRDLAP